MTSFALDSSDAYWWPVELETIAAEGGKTAVHKIDVQFRRLADGEYDEMLQELSEGKLDDKALMDRVCTGQFKGVSDAGKALECTPENFERLIKTRLRGSRRVRDAVLDAYRQAEIGGAEKN